MTGRRWTLRRTLVVTVAVLVATGLVVTSLATILSLRSFVYERLDRQVLEGLEFATGPGAGNAPQGDQGDQGGAADGSGPAPRVGTLQVVLDDDRTVVSSLFVAADGTDVELTDAQATVFETTSFPSRTPVTVDLGGELGSFRVAAQDDGDTTMISGSSLNDVTATTSALTAILVTVAGVTLLLVIIALSLIVRRNLRPLDRVAAVAQRVAGRRLADGAVDIPERVDDADTDEHTEVGRVGSALNTLLGHIEAALASRQHSEEQLQRFIADASHELRTPLASIRGYAQLSLAEDAPMSPTQQRSFDRIAAESERMSSLVDDLLLLARLDAGQSIRSEPVDLTLLAIDAVSDAHAADASRSWRLDVSEETITVRGDENRLRQVVANLLRNARVHTPPGTIVTLTLRIQDQRALLEVADDGPGIDPAVRDRLFERFARGDRARSREAGSTGLGLSIAHAIVAAHQGDITVDSGHGRTVFTVRLPL
jgi:two-component system OmpR family sensor kinase